MSWRWRIARFTSIVVLTPVAFLLLFQSQLLYFPRAYREGEIQKAVDQGVEVIPFRSDQGSQQAYFLPSQQSSDRLWLCFSGNAAQALHWLPYALQLNETQSFLMIDYPGYGACEGSPSPASVREQIRLAVKALRELHPTQPARIGVLGHSLGAAAACMAAVDGEADRAVLISPFTSLVEIANQTYVWPLGHLAYHRYDNRRELTAWLQQHPRARGVILHGENDTLIPPEMGQTLSNLDSSRLSFRMVTGAGHNDVLDRGFPFLAEAVLAAME